MSQEPELDQKKIRIILNGGYPHKAGQLCNRCSEGSRPALAILVLLIGKAEQPSALHLSRLMWVADLVYLVLIKPC